jgi:hypothetical protein
MTEDEAKTKWCPMARVSLPHADECGWQGPANRDPYKSSTYNGANCIGSECMAWRWGERLESEREAYMRGTDLRRTLQSTTDGYCGLVGKP